MSTLGLLWRSLVATALIAGCRHEHADHGHGHSHGHDHGAEETTDSWSVTSWGEEFEIFAEVDMLATAEPATAFTHVTMLKGFSPVKDGKVSAILRSSEGAEVSFSQDQATRPGIFSIEIVPPSDGEYALVFRVETPGLSEEIPSGRVYVGIAAEPGMLVEGPSFPNGPAPPTTAGASEVSFLKEQQWRTPFATAWLEMGAVRTTVDGFATIRPAAGSDVIVSAPTNGIVAAGASLHPGMTVRAGDELLTLLPRAVAERSLSELRSELEFERARLARLQKLIAIGGATQEEIDLSRSRIDALAPQVEGDSETSSLIVRSPINGSVADAWVRAGMSAEAGDSLVRLVKSQSVWLEVALDAREIAALKEGIETLHVRLPHTDSVLSLGSDEFRLISTSPTLDPVTGTGVALLQIGSSPSASLPFGATVEASIGTARHDSGVVIPVSALADDGGTDVVYVQSGGESFERHEVHVTKREGALALISGLDAGVRIVIRGGSMIRRASMLSSGGIEGHVH